MSENYDASFMVGYKKGYEEALTLFFEFLKEQSIVGFDYEHCDLLIERDGRWVSAMDLYLRKIGDEK